MSEYLVCPRCGKLTPLIPLFCVFKLVGHPCLQCGYRFQYGDETYIQIREEANPDPW